MKIEDQVCTLEQAKRLKEFGISPIGFFVHDEIPFEAGRSFVRQRVDGNFNYTGNPCAWTVAELGEMLPQYYPSWRFPVASGEMWVATVICSPKPEGIDNIHTASEFDRFSKTQAEALATLLIALIETEVITAAEVNDRLQKANS